MSMTEAEIQYYARLLKGQSATPVAPPVADRIITAHITDNKYIRVTNNDGQYMHLTPREACSVITSLSEQLRKLV